ncbi:TauD/TfdA family dioxygenase [Streptomyces sp. SID8379]|uniref:TauD/TfdA family dioxygenase n=1 Tax=unclassified Streptomyces TaxID=2593676 RepID=UPI001319DEB9|nr:TauD/TfdA family dioxygenase [Streptomyces sp. HmicA12]MYW69762.1 TauD/TfdA family dioxygenase [Streptomyces sp. SID8379]
MRGKSSEDLRRPCTGPAVWQGRDLARSRSWVLRPGPDQRDELDAAVRSVRARGTPLLKVSADRFPVPSLTADLARVAAELETGRGFVLVRGLPVERYGPAAAAVLLWGLGRHLGVPVSQNATGHMLGHLPYRPADLGPQAFHTDDADMLALLCLRTSGAPGRMRLASSAAVHNTVLARRPELVDGLYRTHHLDRHGEQSPEDLPWHAVPLAHRAGGRLSLRYDRRRLESARHLPGAPRPDPDDRELFDLIDASAADPELRLDIALHAGDLLLLNNHAVLHSDAGFANGPCTERGPQALRLWLTPHRPRALPEAFWGDAYFSGGARGGVAPLDVITSHKPTTRTTPTTPTTPTTRNPHDRSARTPGPIRPTPR